MQADAQREKNLRHVQGDKQTQVERSTKSGWFIFKKTLWYTSKLETSRD